eukprot:GHVP01021522.1.p1 GENE.GHVP01021522.1~~GHVP01021522.1.p1  ORF type:complete len:327 (+),score=34.58 GHVP01021522.1:1605-2585(+)
MKNSIVKEIGPTPIDHGLRSLNNTLPTRKKSPNKKTKYIYLNDVLIDSSSKRDIRNTVPLEDDIKQFNRTIVKEPHKSAAVTKVNLGKNQIFKTQYTSPYPKEAYNNACITYICSICLKYFKSNRTREYHNKICRDRIPGDIVYQEKELKVFSIKGSIETSYCRSLCLLGKTMIYSKTLYYDVSNFVFYPLYQMNINPKLLGYFSRDIQSEIYNLSCITIFPGNSKKGYGSLLISLSYKISRDMNRISTPEKPLSESGRSVYVSYWKNTIIQYLKDRRSIKTSIKEIEENTGIFSQDILSIIPEMSFLKPISAFEFEVSGDMIQDA